MDFDYRSKDLDSLVKHIDKAISSVRANYGTCDVDLDVLIRIAETAKKHVISVKQGGEMGSDFLRDLTSRAKIGSIYSESKERFAALLIHPNASIYEVPEKTSTPPMLKKSDGSQISLGKCLGQGGEGCVYKIPALPGKAVKIYYKQNLAFENYRYIEKKILCLIKKKEAAYIGDTLIAAFPEEILYYQDGSFAGYIMPQFSTSTKLFEIQREGPRRKLFPELDYRGLIVIAHNLAEAVHHLHSHGIVVGDMNPNNILVHADGTVGLIDCDSFDVTNPDTKEHFPCCVGLAELLAPELQLKKKLRNASFSEKSDAFSLAIHIFRLLMDNADPFGFSLTDSAQMLSLSMVDSGNSIVNGECVYFRDILHKQISKWSPTLAILPEDIQALFQKTFDYTAETAIASAINRPTAAEWMAALQKFYNAPLTLCKQDEFHLYLPSLSDCPFCKKQNHSGKSEL